MRDSDPLLSTSTVPSGGNPFGPQLQEYWDRRHFLFSRFDEGIQIDEEGLYSVKPESSALDIASRTAGDVVLDAFCGVGGSAIGFARAGKQVITTDLSETRLKMAADNASIYEVRDNIRFELVDAMEAVKNMAYDTVYLDPPWGGPEYIKQEYFSFAAFDPNPRPLILAALARSKSVVLTVPLNFDFRELVHFRKNLYVFWSMFEGSPMFATAFLEP